MRFIALMPLRGGSKAIPRKNLAPVAGRPLFAWALQAALDSSTFDEIWVSTEDHEISQSVEREMGTRVRVHQRPPHLAEDETSTEAVMMDFIPAKEFDVLCLIQGTSALTKAEDFSKAKTQFIAHQLDSLFSACPFRRFLWTKEGRPLNYDPQQRPRRQEINDYWLLENGAFYMTNRKILHEQNCRLGGKIEPYEMSEESSLEIDSPADLEHLRALMR